jgi:hypothetical protein
VEINFEDVVGPWLTTHFDTLMPEEVCLLLIKGNEQAIGLSEQYLRDNLAQME